MALRRVISLDNKDQWVFRQVTDPPSEWLAVSRMPTNVHIDLLALDLITDPRLGRQENDCQWIGEATWMYRGSFSRPNGNMNRKTVLAFDGLDTYATIVFNGQEICQTQDMFIPERIEVSLEMENLLEITFDSTYLTGEKLVERFPDHRWGCWNGDSSRLAVRKAQFHYGWDWGPTLLTCGPWRPISLEMYDGRISDLWFTTNVDESLESAIIVAKAETEGRGGQITFEVSIEGVIVGKETVDVRESSASATFRTQKPKLWYPHTYGQQPLYTITATLCEDSTISDTAKRRFGLRKAEVVQRRLSDAPGLTFMFEINNIPMFCGGSNWIPADNFTPLIDTKRYRDWVQMAVDGNQIMLRSWGGGIFEEQDFYDACDEMGVLVWQDFLFACGNYPANPDFLSLVRREAMGNVKRLRHHPSIVIWAGNNEDYQYCETEDLDYDPSNHDPQSWLQGSFPARYIYEKILVEVTKELIPDVYYHFGSPFGGKLTTDPHMGDIHQWNVWHGSQERYQDFDKLTGRFVSEFGMEAFPDIQTIDQYLIDGKLDTDRSSQSSTIDFHNKAVGHERRVALYLAENIPYNMTPLERLWKRQWKGPGREYCSGALVWQLNDVWPGQSWSIVDYYLRPKMAYFAIKRELQPLTLGMKRVQVNIPADEYTRAYVRTIHKIQLWACNLSLDSHEAKVCVQTHNLMNGKQRSWPGVVPNVKLLPNRSTEIAEFTIPCIDEDEYPTEADDTCQDEGEERQTVVAAFLYVNGVQVARSIGWPEPLKYVHFPESCRIDLRLASDDANSHGLQEADRVIISSDVPVKGLMLEMASPGKLETPVVFADNGIDLVPGESVTIGVKGLKMADEGLLGVRYLGM